MLIEQMHLDMYANLHNFFSSTLPRHNRPKFYCCQKAKHLCAHVPLCGDAY